MDGSMAIGIYIDKRYTLYLGCWTKLKGEE